MSVKQNSNYCNVCQRQSLYAKPRINHVLHLILTIVTLGLWSIVWLILGVSNSSKPMRCTTCGTPKGFGGIQASPAPPMAP